MYGAFVPGVGVVVLFDLAVERRTEAAQNVEQQPDDDEVDAYVEEQRCHEVHVADERNGHVEGPALQYVPADDHRRDAEAGGEEEPQAEQQTGHHRGCGSQFVTTAGEIAHADRQPGHETGGETSTGAAVPGEQQVDRPDHDDVEDEPDDDLEEHRPHVGSEGGTFGQPRLSPSPRHGLERALYRLPPAGQDLAQLRAGDLDVLLAEEHQARDTGRRSDRDGEFAHRVPGPDVDEDDVDDVVAAAERLGQHVHALGCRRVHAHSGHEQRQRREDHADDETERGTGQPHRRARLGIEGACQTPQHEHEDDDRHGLGEQLGERQVGAAVQQEQHRGAVAGDADEEHGAQPASRTHGPDGCDDHDDAGGDLAQVVGDDDVGARPLLREEQQGQAGHAHEDEQDEQQRQGQRTALDQTGGFEREPVERPHDEPVRTQCRNALRHGILNPLDPGGEDGQEGADGPGEQRQHECRVHAVQEFTKEVQTDSLYSLSETGQHSSIKPLRIGLRIGVPNLVTGNIEYVTPLFDNRLALTVDYLGISRSFTDGIFRFDNFEAGVNVYFNNRGKGLYGSVTYLSFRSGVGFEDYDFYEGYRANGRADFDFDSFNFKLGAKLGNTIYFRVELGYGFGNIPDYVTVVGTVDNREVTAREDIPDVFGVSTSGTLVFNIGFGVAFL